MTTSNARKLRERELRSFRELSELRDTILHDMKESNYESLITKEVLDHLDKVLEQWTPSPVNQLGRRR
jgi:hypothetical protein